jgi:hypothetical protein
MADRGACVHIRLRENRSCHLHISHFPPRSSLWKKRLTSCVVACGDAARAMRSSLWGKPLAPCEVACGDGGESHPPPLPFGVLKSIAESGKRGRSHPVWLRQAQATTHLPATCFCGYVNSDSLREATDGGTTLRYDHDYEVPIGTSLDSRLVPPFQLCRRRSP